MTLEDRQRLEERYARRYAEIILQTLKNSTTHPNPYLQLEVIVRMHYFKQGTLATDAQVVEEIQKAATELAELFLNCREIFQEMYSGYVCELMEAMLARKW